MPATGPVLVIGATGILLPAVLSLSAAGLDVVAVGRDDRKLAPLAAATSVVTINGDLHDASALEATLRNARIEPAGAIIYSADASATELRKIGALVNGPRLYVLASQFGAPPGDDQQGVVDSEALDQTLHGCVLILGWAATPSGPRWHSPDEVSSAALEHFRARSSGTLGTVRPWSQRPTG